MSKEFRHIDCGGVRDIGEACSECGRECECYDQGREGPCNLCEETGINEEPAATQQVSDLDRFREFFKTNGVMF